MQEDKGLKVSSKNISIGTFVLIIVQLGVVVSFAQDMRSDIDHNKESILTLISSRDSKVEEAVVEQMFIVRDTQIKAISDKVDDLKEDSKETNTLLRQVLTRLPEDDN